MKNKCAAQKSAGAQALARRHKTPLPPLPRWRWLVYLAMASILLGIIFVEIGGGLPTPWTSFAAWQASGELGNLAIAAVFSGLIVALIKIFFDLVLLGMAQRKSKLEIAEEVGILVAQVAVGVAAQGLLTAAASAASSSNASSGGASSSGGGGDFGGGGASGTF
ncbi:MAG: hypothetical protein V4858_06985 [Pseudomonadota bacterium]